MKILKLLLLGGTGGRRRSGRTRKPKKQRKPFLLWLLDTVTAIPYDALKAKWDMELWDPTR